MLLDRFLGRRRTAQAKSAHRADANYPYHAVAIRCGLQCCAEARARSGVRLLSRLAPRVPLPNCTMPESCACQFLKFNDRRQEQRRIFGSLADERHYAGSERRRSPGRRATDR
jgi:hypothetical protein